MRCKNVHGGVQCDKEEGHSITTPDGITYFTECETVHGPKALPLRPSDSQRELRRAAARILQLEKALEEIKTMPCGSSDNDASCLCCLHDREIASMALDGEPGAGVLVELERLRAQTVKP